MAVNKKTNITRAQKIRDAGKTPLQKAQANVGRSDRPIEKPIPIPIPRPLPESPIRTSGGESAYIPPIVGGKPNPEYVRNIPPPPPPPRPEGPITESAIRTEIDKIIEDSNEVIKEIITKVDPARPPVDTVQDVVKPPPAITPTEIALENQKDCDNKVEFPNIVINNEVVVDLGQDQTQDFTFDPTVPDPIKVDEIRRGCTDPDAENYDPAALIDDGSCVFADPETGDPILGEPEEPLPNIAAITDFVDSHGKPVFTVRIEDVIDEEEIVLDSGVKLEATVELVGDMARPNLTDSDLILSEEDIEVTKKKTARAELGELAGDSKLASDEDIVIIGDRESIKQKLVRNDNGLILLKPNDSPKLTISLRSQSFTLSQYRRTIDTDFKQLIGKL